MPSHNLFGMRLAHLISDYAAIYPREDSRQNITDPQRMQNAIGGCH